MGDGHGSRVLIRLVGEPSFLVPINNANERVKEETCFTLPMFLSL